MERIGNEVERRLARTGGGKGLALTEITRAWPEAVGSAIARNAWPLRLGRDGTLHVATSSATWAFELDRMSPDVTARLRETLAGEAPARLRFRPGPVPEPGGEQAEGTSARVMPHSAEATPETAEAAASAAALIEDADLRALVARAARASLGKSVEDSPSDRGFW
jgi:hypothetical protein